MLGGVGLALLLLLVGSVGAAFAQVEGSSRYSIPSAGFEIQLPPGWQSRLTDEFAIAYPQGPESDVAMTVLAADRPNTKNLMTSKIGIELDEVVIHEDESCKSLINEIIQLAGTRVFHTIQECTAEEQYSKTSTYVIFTLNDSVAVSLSAISPEAYDRNIATFEESLRTITVNSPIDFRTGLEIILGTTTLYTENITVGSATSEVRFTAGSTSRIRDVEFDEESMRISIVVDEVRRSEGHLLVPAHRLLTGPYQVYLNGEPYEDFVVIQADGKASQLIDIEYARGVHTIDIVGTAVVPEFDATVAIVLVGAMSSVILYLRTTNGRIMGLGS